MSDDPLDPLRESRAALVLMAVAVAAVLVFGAVTLVTQIGAGP